MENNTQLSHYTYLFIRKDLSREQQIIQTAHAIHMVGMKQLEKNIIPNAVLIGSEDVIDLQLLSIYLSEADIKHEIFFEPDIDEYTAIATYPIREDSKEREIFTKFETLKF